KLAEARLYLCTDARAGLGDLAEFAEAALSGGVDILQLRDKTSGVPLEARQELAALEVLADACRKHGALLAVNDRADVARHAGADVLHLGQDDLPVQAARELLGDTPAVGRSTHSIQQASAAATEPGVDYFCAGPCWATPTSPGCARTYHLADPLLVDTADGEPGPCCVQRGHLADQFGSGSLPPGLSWSGRSPTP